MRKNVDGDRRKKPPMKSYTVGVYINYFGTVTVEAKSEAQAWDIVLELDDPHGIAQDVLDVDYEMLEVEEV